MLELLDRRIFRCRSLIKQLRLKRFALLAAAVCFYLWVFYLCTPQFQDIWERHGVLKQSLFLGEGRGVYRQTKNLSAGTSLLALMTRLAVRHLQVPTVLAPTISARCDFFFHMTSLQGPVKYWSLFIFSGIKETTNTTDRYYIVYV